MLQQCYFVEKAEKAVSPCNKALVGLFLANRVFFVWFFLMVLSSSSDTILIVIVSLTILIYPSSISVSNRKPFKALLLIGTYHDISVSKLMVYFPNVLVPNALIYFTFSSIGLHDEIRK